MLAWVNVLFNCSIDTGSGAVAPVTLRPGCTVSPSDRDAAPWSGSPPYRDQASVPRVTLDIHEQVRECSAEQRQEHPSCHRRVTGEGEDDLGLSRPGVRGGGQPGSRP